MTRHERNITNVLKAIRNNLHRVADACKDDEAFCRRQIAVASEISSIINLIEDKDLLKDIAAIYNVTLE